MHVSPNPHRTALHNATIEDGPLTARQRRIADAVRLCNSTSDFVAIPREQATTIDVCTIPHHYSADLTDRLVREGLERAQAELDRLKRMYAAYGIEPFVPQQSQVPARQDCLVTSGPPHGVHHDVVARIASKGARWR